MPKVEHLLQHQPITRVIPSVNDLFPARMLVGYPLISSSSFSSISFTASQDGILFQVKAVYAYSPVHGDELSIKTNDVINVIRVVRRDLIDHQLSLISRLKKVGMKVFSMEIVAYFHRIM